MARTTGWIATGALAGLALLPASALGQTYYPPPTTPPPPPPPPAAPPPPAPPCTTMFTSKLSIARASTLGGALDVLAPITSRASGRVNVDYHAASRHTRFTSVVNSVDGRVRFRRNLPSAQARLGTGIVTLEYPGDADTRSQTVRLRGARNKANLTLSRPRIVNNRIQASGEVNSRARGVVRLQLEYQFICDTRVLRFRGTIEDGRWSIDEPLSGRELAEIGLRTGSLHSYTLFTGYFERRIRGEMRSFQVLASR